MKIVCVCFLLFSYFSPFFLLCSTGVLVGRTGAVATLGLVVVQREDAVPLLRPPTPGAPVAAVPADDLRTFQNTEVRADLTLRPLVGTPMPSKSSPVSLTIQLSADFQLHIDFTQTYDCTCQLPAATLDRLCSALQSP